MSGGEPSTPDDGAEADLRDIAGLDVVESLLQVICDTTGLGFAAIARVTADRWTALAVRDGIGFGLLPGQQLDIDTTLCKEVRQARQPVVIDHASLDPLYRSHHTPRLYGIESYISVPIVLVDGSYFGNLCAIDRKPAALSAPGVLHMFELFARLIALQLENHRERRHARAEIEIERANSALREQFIAVVGHDLRNPLSGILASAGVLQRYAADPQTVRVVADRIAGSARRMAQLIGDVVDFARGRLGGGIGLELQAVHDLGVSLQHVVEELRVAYPGRQLDAAIEIAPTVRCDRTRVEQLASNLLANALLHGAPEQPVVFRAGVEGSQLVLVVANRGEPIATDMLPTMFQAFSQGRLRHGTQGLGLGLYICDQVVKAHGGSLSVASSSEQGTRFTATLPLDGPAAHGS